MKNNVFSYETLFGGKGNLLNFGQLWQRVLGVAVTFFVVFLGQNLANKVSGYVPTVDTRGTNIIQTAPRPTATSTKKFY